MKQLIDRLIDHLINFFIINYRSWRKMSFLLLNHKITVIAVIQLTISHNSDKFISRQIFSNKFMTVVLPINSFFEPSAPIKSRTPRDDVPNCISESVPACVMTPTLYRYVTDTGSPITTRNEKGFVFPAGSTTRTTVVFFFVFKRIKKIKKARGLRNYSS